MDLESVQNNALAKLPLLKQGDYDTWRLRIESYIELQDYALWEIIDDGNSFTPVARTTTNVDGTSTSTIPSVVTAEEKIQKKNDLKARSILMMTLPSEHLLTFNQYKDSKTLFEAIEARFGGNEATKKTQKTLLKQIFEDLKSQYHNLRIELNKSKSDLANYKRGLASVEEQLVFYKKNEEKESNQIKIDNYNLLTLYCTFTNNTARLSDATFYAFLANQPNGSQVVHEDLEQIHEDDLEEMDLKWQLALLSLKARKFYQRTCKKIIINGSDIAGYDKTKVECFNCHKMGNFARECRGPRNQESRPRNQESMPRSQDSSKRTVNVKESSSKAMLAINGVGIRELNKSEFDLANYKRGLASVEEKLVFYKKNEEKESNQIKIDNFENASKSLDKLIGCQISDNNRKGVGYNAVAPPPTGLFAPLTINLSNSGLEEFKQPEFEGYKVKMVQKRVLNNVKKGTGQREVRPVWNNAMRTYHQKISNSRRNFAPTAVLTKSGLVPISTARQSSSRAAASVSTVRPIKTAAPKSFVNVAKTRPNAFQKSHSPSRRPFYQQTTLKNRNLNNKVNTVKVNSVNTAKGKRVTSAVGEQGINAVKSKACWVWRPKIKVLDHVSKNNGSYICKQFDYVDPTGLEFKVLVVYHTTNGHQFTMSNRQERIGYSRANDNWISKIDCLLSSEVGDEAVHKELGDRMERAATTASSFKTEQDSDAQTRFEAASKSPMIHLSQEVTHLEVGMTVCNKWNSWNFIASATPEVSTAAEGLVYIRRSAKKKKDKDKKIMIEDESV
ncbi:putative ribonuclease H-like domain-containing protein [Tanacetum coccineum]